MDDTRTIAKKYYQRGLWVTFGLTLIMLIAAQVGRHTEWVSAIVAAALFSLLTTIAYALSWRQVASKSQGSLGKFYIAASAIRMMTAFIVVLIFVLTAGSKSAAMVFAVVFVIFYIVMLVFDTVYFAKVEKRNKSVKK